MIEKAIFGKTSEGETVDIFTLTNGKGIKARVTNYGGIVTELHVPDRNGHVADVVLGFDNLERYLKGHPHFGSITGRFANRICKGKFQLNGKPYSLAINNGPNHLHGGLRGIDKRIWRSEPAKSGLSLKLAYDSPDGEEGYPGNLRIEVTYSVTEENEFIIEYSATTDRSTPINLTNHSYFNLAGAGAGEILEHELRLNCDFFTPVDEVSIPTGEIRSVEGTLMDFRTAKRIGRDFGQIKGSPGGYDHNYVIKKSWVGELAMAAECNDQVSGRTMSVFTTEPGVQLYTANYLDGSIAGKGGKVYRKNSAFCLECQHFPDSVNHPHFPSVILNPGETYNQRTVHRFGAV
jgi:aldose 1-epimerase